MRLASFNLENLFSRPEVMNRESWAAGREVLSDVEQLNSLLAKPAYSAADKAAIKLILDKYKFGNRNIQKRPFRIQEVRKHLFKVPKGTTRVEVVAAGRDAWVGWIDLTREDIDPRATTFTGQVIKEVNADVMCTVEIEDRITLARFNEQVLGAQFQCAYPFDLCVDGNDPRGIDVGLFSRHNIASVRSHIFDSDGQGTIFSRDCAEYEVELPGNKTLWVLANHFKSKGYGSMTDSNTKRTRQAERVAEIYRAAKKRSDLVAVVGDLNDTPDSQPLTPLVKQTDLKDIGKHPTWQGVTGTYGTGKSKSSKIDYILLSPALWQRVQQVGIERRGVYAPSLHIMWPGVTEETAASDHAAIWVDLNV